jgi:isoleucyl-tRNA synthetase
VLDRWIIARLQQLVAVVRSSLDDYNAMVAAREVDTFIEQLSTWYVRRSRRRFWKAENDEDKLAAYATLYECLTTLSRLIAPFMPFLAEHLYQGLVRTVQPDSAVSVHLTDYPVPGDSQVDQELLAAMAVAQEVVALGRAARDRANIRVRQPLARMFVKVPTAAEQDDVSEMRDIILDELNVKELDFAGAADEFMAYSVRPNLPVLGPRFGRRLPAIRSALEKLEPTGVVEALEREEPVRLDVDGEVLELQSSDILASAREREGYAAMASDGYLVALDTHISRPLLEEGWAREVVRRLNDWRKAAGFNVEDRIAVRYQASPDLGATIDRYHEYIAQETLAVSLESGALDDDAFQGDARFDDQWLTVTLRRVTSW